MAQPKKRKTKKPVTPTHCETCGDPLIPKTRRDGTPKRPTGSRPRRFCSDKCRFIAWDTKHPRLPIPPE